MSSTQLDESITCCTSNWLKGWSQRGVVYGVTSGWQPDTSGVLQGSILGTVLFNVFRNDLEVGVECPLSKFANDTKFGRAVDSKELDVLERWAITNRMKFSRNKYWILHLRQGNAGYTHKLGHERLESSTAERDLGVWVDGKLNRSQL